MGNLNCCTKVQETKESNINVDYLIEETNKDLNNNFLKVFLA